MGGHGHHHEPYKVPDASIYKVENIPQLVEVQKALARQGLKDPWLRNEVWRYDPKQFGTHRQRLLKFAFRGLPLGAALAVGTIAAEIAFGIDYHGDHHAKHGGHGHDEGHH